MTSLTPYQVAQFEPSSLHKAAERLAALAGQLTQLSERGQRWGANLTGQWEGQAAAAADRTCQTLSQQCRQGAESVQETASSVVRHTTDLELVQSQVHGLIMEVTQSGGQVTADWRFVPPPTSDSPFSPPKSFQQAALEAALQARLNAARLRAHGAVDQLVAVLESGGAGLPSPAELDKQVGFGQAVGAIAIAGIPTVDKYPDARTWWNSLDESDQQALVRADPELLAAMVGLPSAAKNLAQRQRLVYDLENTPQGSVEHKRLADLRKTLYRHAEAGKDLYLLDFDVSGDGTFVVAQGDPDVATFVSINIPGMGTGFGALDGEITKSSHIYAAMSKETTEPISTVATLSYDAPNNPGQAATLAKANQGADNVAAMISGVAASRLKSSSSIHVSAHSYGSPTLAAALKKHRNLPVNAVTFYGSPGVGTNHVSDLDVPGDRVFAMTNKWDPVTHVDQIDRVGAAALLAAASLPLGAAFVVGDTLGVLGDRPAPLGKDPEDKSFGAKHLQVSTSKSHSYITKKSLATRVLAKIATGKSVTEISELVRGSTRNGLISQPQVVLVPIPD